MSRGCPHHAGALGPATGPCTHTHTHLHATHTHTIPAVHCCRLVSGAPGPAGRAAAHARVPARPARRCHPLPHPSLRRPGTPRRGQQSIRSTSLMSHSWRSGGCLELCCRSCGRRARACIRAPRRRRHRCHSTSTRACSSPSKCSHRTHPQRTECCRYLRRACALPLRRATTTDLTSRTRFRPTSTPPN